MKKFYVLVFLLLNTLCIYAAGITAPNSKLCTQTYVTIGNIVISETGAVADFGLVGTATVGNYLFIKAPTGFEFDPAFGNVTSAGGGNILTTTLVFVTSSVIAVSYNVDNNTVLRNDVLTISNIRTKALAVSGATSNATIGAGSTAIIGIGVGNTVATFQSAITAISFSPASPKCNNDATYALNGTHTLAASVSLTSATYSGTGVSGTNYIPPATAGNYPVVYTVTTNGPTCTFTTSSSIDINAAPIVTLTADETSGTTDDDNAICIGDNVLFNGYGANSYKFYKVAATLLSSTSPYNTTSLANGDVIFVEGTALNGCKDNSPNKTFTVNPIPPAPTFNPTNSTFAISDAGFWLDTLGTPLEEANRLSGSPSYFTGPGVVFQSNRYFFYPNVAGNGTHSITYHFVDPITYCENTASKSIIVGTGVAAGNIQGINSTYCSYDGLDNIYIDFCEICFFGCSSYGGMQYSLDGGSAWTNMLAVAPLSQNMGTCFLGTNYRHHYQIDPSILGSGIVLFRYFYTQSNPFFGGSTTVFSASQSTLVAGPPSISITNAFNTYNCSNLPDEIITFDANGASGAATFSSLTTNFVQFNAGDSKYYIHWDQGTVTETAATRTITMNFTDAVSGCTNTINKNVQVALKPATPTFYTGYPRVFCKTDYVDGRVNSTSGYTYLWSQNAPGNPPSYTDNYYPTFVPFSYYPRGVLAASEVYYVKTYLYSSCVSNSTPAYNMTVNNPVTANIGQYATVCSNQTISLNQLQKTGPSVTQTWYTIPAMLPTAFAPNNTSNSPTYTLTPGNIAQGNVSFRVITADPDGVGSGCPAVYKDTIVYINKLPVITATSPLSTYCSDNLITLDGAVSISSAAPLTWTKGSLGGSNAGISTPNAFSSYFTPDAGEKNGGNITFYVESSDVDGAGPCPIVSANVTITINPEVVLNPGITTTVCGGSNIALSGTCITLGGDLGATWSKGVWNQYILPTTNPKNTIYTPTGLEPDGGTFTFTLTSDDPDGAGPCLAVAKNVDHIINKAASVSAGSTIPIAGVDSTWYCSNTVPLLISSLNGSSASTVTWTKSSGSGAIVSPTAFSTSYSVSPGDYAAGTTSYITFTATTNDPDLTGPCLPATDITTIVLNPHLTVDAGSDIVVCANQTINLNGNVKIGGINRVSSNTWRTYDGLGGFTQNGPSNFTGTYNPFGTITSSGTVVPGSDELGIGAALTAYLVSNDPDGVGMKGPCLADSSYLKITINPLPIPHYRASMSTEYCLNGAAVILDGNLGNQSPSANFTGGTYVTPLGSSFQFTPATTEFINATSKNGGTYSIRYNFTDGLGCQNYVDTLVKVFPYPYIKFTMSTVSPIFAQCQYDTITFTNTSTINSTVFPSTLNQSDWYIDNATLNNVANISTLNTFITQNAFQNYGIHPISLITTTNSGGALNCTNRKDTSIVFGPYPATNYSWSRPCSVDSIRLVSLSSIPTGYSFSRNWTMNGAGSFKASTTNISANPIYKYAGVGIYNVTLTDTTNIYNCISKKTKEVFVVPTYGVTPSDPYDSSFAKTNLNWAPSVQNDTTQYSWQYGVPTGKVINSPDSIWITKLIGSYNIGELSYLNSPCFNFSTLDKPMITLKLWSETRNLAGAMLEASVGNTNTWTTIGQIGTGINWYNTPGVVGLIGASGSNPIAQGFSGELGKWDISKIGLSQYSNQTNLMRFRITFGSYRDTAALNRRDGIALDSVWIGNRSKVVLLEHFTNSLNTASNVANDTINSFLTKRAGDAISIQYHTSFPGVDNMNLNNPADPSSRVLYYGVTGVPRTYLDGIKSFSQYALTPNSITITDIDNKALEEAKFQIDISSKKVGLNIDVKALLVSKAILTEDVVVQVAALERIITSPLAGGSSTNGYQWVLRKMMPDAAGTYLNRDWVIGDSLVINQNWNFNLNNFYDTSKVEIVVFVQNPTTKEVYQAAKIGSNGNTSTPVVTEVTTAVSEDNLLVYPVPSDDEINVLFANDTKDEADYSLINDLGVPVVSGKIAKGVRMLSFNSKQFASGIYYLTISKEDGSKLHRKIIVLH